MQLPDVLRRLRSSVSGHAFVAEPISSDRNILLGVDSTGRPALFVIAPPEHVGPPMRTAQLYLGPAETYVLTMVDGSQRRETFHTILCDATDGPDLSTFLVLVEAFLTCRAPPGVSYADLTTFFRSMIRLFAVRPVSNLKQERQGLWGELFMMSRIRGFWFWAPFWHNPLTHLFDFSAPGKRVEVKTTLGPERVHHFSHRQIFALESEQIVVASLLLKEDDTGVSLADLIAECRASLAGTYQALILEAAARRAGMQVGSEKGPCFNAVIAEASLAWYRSTELPQFRMPEPLGVSETNYRVDVSLATPIESHEVDLWLDTWVSPNVLEAAV